MIFSPILLLIFVVLLVILISYKKREWSGLLIGGAVFFIISLVSAVLTMICYETVKGGHPDAGMVCLLPGMAFLPYWVIFTELSSYFLFVIGIIINTIIGIIIGAIIEVFKKR